MAPTGQKRADARDASFTFEWGRKLNISPADLLSVCATSVSELIHLNKKTTTTFIVQ